MPSDFDCTVLSRLPLAEAVLSLWQWICHDDHLADLYDRHRGQTYEKKISFSLLTQLIRDALLEHQGSGHQSFSHGREDGILDAALSSVYDKLARLPIPLSEAFLAEGADRLRQVLPESTPGDNPVPASLREFEVVVVDGKVVKGVPKRLKPARGLKGGLLGGKGLAALHLSSGLVLALATDPDGEANDAKLVPALLPQVRERLPGVRLWVGDRQFCDLKQGAAFTAEGDHFLVRYHPKVHFHADPERPSVVGQDARGRAYREEWGWLGAEGSKGRRYVRRVKLSRPDEEDIILVTDLVDAERYPAADLLELYLARWGVERVFQQITEVFGLSRLIGTTPEGTLFQLSFCLLLYGMIQVVRGYVAKGQERKAETISSELLFVDVKKQLVALHELVEASQITVLLRPVSTAEEMRGRLGRLLGGQWSECWRKAPKRKSKPPAAKKANRDHTSVFRILHPPTAKSKKKNA